MSLASISWHEHRPLFFACMAHTTARCLCNPCHLHLTQSCCFRRALGKFHACCPHPLLILMCAPCVDSACPALRSRLPCGLSLLWIASSFNSRLTAELLVSLPPVGLGVHLAAQKMLQPMRYAPSWGLSHSKQSLHANAWLVVPSLFLVVAVDVSLTDSTISCCCSTCWHNALHY